MNMPYRIVLMTYLRLINPTWQARILTQITTVQMEELLITEILSQGCVKQLWDRVTSEANLGNFIYTKMLERVYFTKQDSLIHVAV